MRLKYQTRTISKNLSVSGGTLEELNTFFSDILNALIDMGAPLKDVIVVTEAPYPQVCATLQGESLSPENGGGLLMLGAGSNHILMCAGTDPNFMNYFYSTDPVNPLSSNGFTATVRIHAVKSGDSFFFGILGYSDSPTMACINYAITPMRRLSDPSANLGYAIVQGTQWFDNTVYISRTLPFIDGFNYNYGYLNGHMPPVTIMMPEVDSGKIPLIPYFSGIEDIYYDKVYVSSMLKGDAEEKAFETDKGTFLISGQPYVPWDTMQYCGLAFDITEAVNSAQ